jgi:hypothetical protein
MRLNGIVRTAAGRSSCQRDESVSPWLEAPTADTADKAALVTDG